jgi:hypothetical protein
MPRKKKKKGPGIKGDWPNYDLIVGEDYEGVKKQPKRYFRVHVDIPNLSKGQIYDLSDYIANGEKQKALDLLVGITGVSPGEQGHTFLKVVLGIP